MKLKSAFNLNSALSNAVSGSAELVQMLNSNLKKYENDPEKIKRLVSKLRRDFVYFGTVQEYLNRLDKALISKDSKKLHNYFLQFESGQGDRFKIIYLHAKPKLKKLKAITTLSNSATILEILKLWKKDKGRFTVKILESRPKMDGRILAQELLNYGIKVELYPDALAAEAVEKSDAVFIGAEMVLKNKSGVNRIGSMNLALLCKYYKKPLYMFADKSKFSLKSRFIPDLKPPAELWNYEDPNLKVVNKYFEEVKKNFITQTFTD